MTSEPVRPTYAGMFHCIGAECEDDCCHGWNVSIDRATYEKYASRPELQAVLEQCVLVNATPTDADYARVKSTSSGVCPFLSEDRLCAIQKKHGAEYLSQVCSTYPRRQRMMDGLETTLSLSCPEAARLVLLNPQLLPGEEAPSTHARYGQFLLKNRAVLAPNGKPLEFFWPLRNFSIALLKDRRYPLWQRLFILGMFCGRLQVLIASRQSQLVPKLLNDYSEIIIEKKLRAAMDGIAVRPVLQLDVVLRVVNRLAESLNSSTYRECIDEFLLGIGHDRSLPLENCLPAYAEAAARYYQPFVDAHPFLFENYLVNYVLEHRFPLEDSLEARGELANPQTAYFMMCIHYAVMQTVLIGMAGRHREEFGARHAVKLLYSFTRTADHNRAFLKEVEAFLKDANLLDPSGMALLLKNPAAC